VSRRAVTRDFFHGMVRLATTVFDRILGDQQGKKS
jgi:hypothetical protein